MKREKVAVIETVKTGLRIAVYLEVPEIRCENLRGERRTINGLASWSTDGGQAVVPYHNDPQRVKIATRRDEVVDALIVEGGLPTDA